MRQGLSGRWVGRGVAFKAARWVGGGGPSQATDEFHYCVTLDYIRMTLMILYHSRESQIKKFPDKTKVESARESLGRYEFPASFSPPYNPMVAMGNLNITKCRVMDSKKVRENNSGRSI